MDAKTKAEELVEKYHGITFPDGYCGMTVYESIQCAIIAVEDILTELHNYGLGKLITKVEPNNRIDYWQEVLNHLKQMK